jgi:pimeloyl-ACP methyl ester carboxylesterase
MAAMSSFRILRWGSDELPPVVCLHDLRGHARRFERLARMLEPGRMVVAYDLRGHGRSPWSGPHTVEQHLDDLSEVLDECAIDQTGLIGESFGARLALEYAIRNQERVNSITLLEPPLAPSPEAMLRLAQDERRGGGFTSMDEAIERRREQDGLIHTPRALLEEEMGEHLVADEDGRFHYRYSHEAVAAALEELAHPATHLNDVPCPTMVVQAEDSSWLSDEDLERLTDEIRRVRIEQVPGGRVVLWDALAESSALVRDFLVARRKTA